MRTDKERLDFLADDPIPEGFANLEMDVYEYAIQVANEAGGDEPTKEDQREGFRRMIDAAMDAEEDPQ